MLIMTICAGFVVDLQNRQASLQAQRVDVLAKLNVVRAKLEGKVYGNFQLVRGLVAAIATEPDMSHARYDALAANVFSVDTELRNIAAAPNLVVEYVYPLQGNQEALGLDYRLQPLQRQAALRARRTKTDTCRTCRSSAGRAGNYRSISGFHRVGQRRTVLGSGVWRSRRRQALSIRRAFG